MRFLTESLRRLLLEEAEARPKHRQIRHQTEDWWNDEWCWHYDTERWWKWHKDEWFTQYFHGKEKYIWYSWAQWQVPRDPKYTETQ